jgi:hypothetical protein
MVLLGVFASGRKPYGYPRSFMAPSYTPGPSWRFELVLLACAALLIAAALVAIFW